MNLIISENYLKEYTTINKNVDMAILTPILDEVQTMYIIKLLGQKLFNQILSEVGTNTVTAANQTLLDSYVIPCMLQYAKAETYPEISFRMRNKGTMQMNSDNSQGVDLNTIQWLMDRARNKAEDIAERCTKFLVNNTTTYPLYLDNTEYDEIKPNKTNFTSGIYVGDDDDCGCGFNKYR